MPSGKVATLRQKTFGGKPQHGHCTEYLLEVLGIIISILFIVGCYCFESEDAVVNVFGDWLFIVACVLNCVIGVFELLEKLHHSSLGNTDERDEVLESLWFMISDILFTWGCFYFLPTVATTFQRAGSWGAWLCILGSFSLCFAIYYTVLTFSSDPAVLKMLHNLEPNASAKARQLKKVQMFLLLVGAILFTVGSFMYRPAFDGNCPQHSTNPICVSVASYGTKCYLWGSYLFLVASLISAYVVYVQHQNQKQEDDGSEKASDPIHAHGASTLLYNSL